MRVLHIINDLRVGGAERLLVDLAPRLRASGIELEVLTLAPRDSYLTGELRASSVPLHDDPDAISLRSPRQIGRIAGLLPAYDIVHVQLFPAQLWVAVASSGPSMPGKVRPKLVTTEQNTYNRRRKALYQPADRWMYGRFDRIIAITSATAEALAEWVPSTRDRTQVIHNAADIARFANAVALPRASLGVPPDSPLLACVGRLEPQKDQATLVRMMPSLPGAHLALIGDGVLRSPLERQAEQLGVRDRIHFLGRRADVPEVLKACDVYIQPSRWEGFGIAVVEAMAAGVPVVCSDVPGMRDVTAEAALICPPGDVEAFALAVRRLLKDPDERKRRADAGKARAALFTMERCVAEHRALYESLMSPTWKSCDIRHDGNNYNVTVDNSGK